MRAVDAFYHLDFGVHRSAHAASLISLTGSIP